MQFKTRFEVGQPVICQGKQSFIKAVVVTIEDFRVKEEYHLTDNPEGWTYADYWHVPVEDLSPVPAPEPDENDIMTKADGTLWVLYDHIVSNNNYRSCEDWLVLKHAKLTGGRCG